MSLDADLMYPCIDAEESQVASSSGEKELADKMCGIIDQMLCIVFLYREKSLGGC